MTSDIVNSNQFVSADQLKTERISIDRINNTNSVGSRMWFVVQDEAGIYYHKWSLLMDDSDAALAVARVGDILDITYWVETISDPVFQRIHDFERRNLVSVKIVTQ